MKRLFLLAAAFAAGIAHAGAWPDKPIRVVVPYPPGGPSDIVIRGSMDKLQTALKQPIVIENKPGAAGNLGAAEVARAAPDGYTWLVAIDSTVTINPHVYAKPGFKSEALVPVTMMTTMTQTLVCNPGLGVKTLADFARQVGAGTVRSYGSGGAGSPGHLAMELFTSRASLKLQHVPYKGPAPALQDIIGGQVDCGFLAGPTVLPHVKTGRLTAVAVSGLKRSPTLPDVPTVSESGYPNYDANSVLVLFAPQKTPHAVVAAFRGAVVDALKSPAIEQMIRQSDQAVVANTPSEAAAELAKISQKWQQVVQRIKLQVD